MFQQFVDEVNREHGVTVDAVITTDGDSDRPLVAPVNGDGQVELYGGDLLGIIAADYLDADFVAVPISANPAVDDHFGGKGIRPR